MPFRIVEGSIKTASSEVRVEPYLDRSGAAKAQFRPLNGIDQYGEYDRLDTVSISEYSLTPARQRDCRYVIRTPVAYAEDSLSDPDAVRYCYKSALQIVHDLGLRSVAFPLIGVADGENSKELALQIAAEEIRRFLNDNEDTEKGLSDFVPFKNLFNEFWAKDTSRKVKAALHAKHAAGECTAIKPPFGYIKDPEHKNHIIVDEETRWIVEKMFDMAAHGAGTKRIAQTLAKEKIPTPGYTAYQRSGLYANIYQDAPPEKAFAWSISVVNGILKDETYIGNSIHNKQGTVSYKNKKRLKKPTDDWFRVEGTHEPIIDADVFRQVQEQIGNRRRAMKDAEPQIFAGLLKCADCGKAMVVSAVTARATYRYYNCNNYRKYSRITGACTSHSIRYDVLYQHILSRVQYWVERAHTDEQELLKRLLSTTDQERQAVLKKQAAELKKAEKRKEDVDRRFAKVYEDWADERITEYNFKMLSQKYQAEQQEIDEKISQLRAAMEKEHQTVEDAEKWVNLVKQYEYPTELTTELLNALIEKILIHEPVKLASGYKDQEIEIFYRFVGKLD